MASIYPRLYTVIRQIPKGRVATYGQIALLAGIPGHARQVGYGFSCAAREPSHSLAPRHQCQRRDQRALGTSFRKCSARAAGTRGCCLRFPLPRNLPAPISMENVVIWLVAPAAPGDSNLCFEFSSATMDGAPPGSSFWKPGQAVFCCLSLHWTCCHLCLLSSPHRRRRP